MINYKIKIFDNFLEAEDLKELSVYAKNLNNDRDVHVFHNEIDPNNKILNASIDKGLLIRLNKKYLEKGISILKELNEEKVSLIDYSDFTIIKTKKKRNFQYMTILLINYYLVLFIYIQKIMLGLFFIILKAAKIKILLNGKLTEQFSSLGLKEKHGIHTKQIVIMTELH